MYAHRVFFTLVMMTLALPSAIGAETHSGSPLSEYHQFLERLGKKDPASITRAVGRYNELFPGCDQETRNKAFVEFVTFYDHKNLGVDFVDRLLAKYGESLPADALLLHRHPQLDKDLMPYGLTVFPSEEPGYWRVSIRKGFMRAAFGSLVSGSVRQYIDYRDGEVAELYQCDGEVGIPFDELADRVGHWATYIQAYPNSPFRDSAQVLLRTYGFYLFHGMDNTRIFTPEMKPEARKAYEHLLNTYPKTDLAPILREYLDAVQKNAFRWSDALSPIQQRLLGAVQWSENRRYKVDYYDYAPRENP